MSQRRRDAEMTQLLDRTNPKLKELRIFVQFSKEELQKRRYLLPPATIVRSYAGNDTGSETVFHVLQLDGETPFTPKDEPVVGKPPIRRRWILARSKAGALENLLKTSTQSERVDVVLYVRRDDCFPCSDILDTDRDTLEICPGVIALMPVEKRGRTNKIPQTSIRGRTLTIGVDDSEWLDLAPKVQLNTLIEVQLWIGSSQLLNHWGIIVLTRIGRISGLTFPAAFPDLRFFRLDRELNLYNFAEFPERVF